MPKINGNEITPGKTLEYDGGLWMAVKSTKVKPGKGGAYNQVELKNILNGTKLNQRFRSDEAVDEIYLDKKDYTFLFAGDEDEDGNLATAPLHAQLRRLYIDLAMEMILIVPEGRERSLALTELQNSLMWANAGVAMTAPLIEE